MATPEAPRLPEQGLARVAGKAARGQNMGRMPGLSPIPRRDGARSRRAAPEGATSGLILEIDTQFEMTDWTTAAVPDWVVRDSWGSAPPTKLDGTSLIRPGVTLGAGIWSMTMSAEAFVPSGIYLRGTFSYQTEPNLSLQTAPGNTIMGIGTGPIEYLSATVAGLRVTSGYVELTLSARDSDGVNAPSGVYVDRVQLTAVRLSG